MNRTVGVIGLGRMGGGIAQRLTTAGFLVYGYDRASSTKAPVGVTMVHSYEKLLRATNCILLLVPAGEIVDEVLTSLVIAKTSMKSNELVYVVDCGNSLYTDTLRRHEALVTSGVILADAGVSGGVHGAQDGYCVMVGGTLDVVAHVEPLLRAFSAPHGYAHVGPVGAGHYVKMVHNAIEYGILQAYAEGFHLLKEGHYPHLNTAELAKLWQHGSIIRSRLLELLSGVLTRPDDISQTSGVIHENGTGRWAVHEAKRRNVELPVIAEALKVRSWSRESGGNYATKLVALLRNAFGGHAVEREKKEGGK